MIKRNKALFYFPSGSGRTFPIGLLFSFSCGLWQAQKGKAKRAAPSPVQLTLASIPGGQCKGFFGLDKRPDCLDFPPLQSDLEWAGRTCPDKRSTTLKGRIVMKNWQLAAILSAAAFGMYLLFWLNMTSR